MLVIRPENPNNNICAKFGIDTVDLYSHQGFNCILLNKEIRI